MSSRGFHRLAAALFAVALAATAWLLISESAAAQAGCRNHDGKEIVCAVPFIAKPLFSTDYFYITVQDEATGEDAPFASFETAPFTELKVEATSPAGATLSSERRGPATHASRYFRCEAEDAAECVLYRVADPGMPGWSDEGMGTDFRHVRLNSLQELFQAVPLRVSAPDGTTEVTLRATLKRPGAAVDVVKDFTIAWSGASELVVSTFPGYDFVRSGGGAGVFHRDAVQVWIGSSSLAFVPSQADAFGSPVPTWNADGDPVFEIVADEGTFIYGDRFGAECTLYRGGLLESPNRCVVPPNSVSNSLSSFGVKYWAYGHSIWASPPQSGAGSFDVTVTWRLADGSVQTKTATIRYGEEVPSDLAEPYPVVQASGPAAGASFGYAEEFSWRARAVDGRNGAALQLSESAGYEMRLSWLDPEVLTGAGAEAELPVYRDIRWFSANQKVFDASDIRAALGGRSTWTADLTGTVRAPHGPGGGMRGVFVIDSPRLDQPAAWLSRYYSAINSRTLLGDYTYTAPALDSGPEVRARLPQDVDQRLSAGATEPIEAGLGGTAPSIGIAPGRRNTDGITRPCIHHVNAAAGRHQNIDDPGAWPPATWNDPATTGLGININGVPYNPPLLLDYADSCMWNDIVDGGESYLVLSGPATWEHGGKRLNVGAGTAHPVFACSTIRSDLSFICSMRAENGAFPRLIVDSAAADGDRVTLTASITHVDGGEPELLNSGTAVTISKTARYPGSGSLIIDSGGRYTVKIDPADGDAFELQFDGAELLALDWRSWGADVTGSPGGGENEGELKFQIGAREFFLLRTSANRLMIALNDPSETLTADTEVHREDKVSGWVAGLGEQETTTMNWQGATPALAERGNTVFGSVSFEVAEVREVDAVVLQAVGEEAGTTVRAGGSLPLRLRILDSNENASPSAAISSITLTASGGGALAGDYCSGSASCTPGLRSGPPLAAGEGLELARETVRIGERTSVIESGGSYVIRILEEGSVLPNEMEFSGADLLALDPHPIGVDLLGGTWPLYEGRPSPLIFSVNQLGERRPKQLALLRTEDNEPHIGYRSTSATATADISIYRKDLAFGLERAQERLGDIRISYRAPSRGGEAAVLAAVVTTDARSISARLPIIVGGPADALAASGGGIARTSAVDGDLDELAFSITAKDSGGRDAALPHDAAVSRFTGPGGAVVSAGITGAISCSDAARFKCELKIGVTAPASSPLAAGAYAAHLSGGGLSGRAEFRLAGRAETISLAESFADRAIGRPLAIEATVSDADGNPAADGTPVAFGVAAVGGTGATAALIAAPLGGTAKTENGAASARLVAISSIISLVTADAGADSAPAAAASHILDLRDLAGDPEAEAAIRDGFSVHRGGATSASELLAANPGIESVSLWNGYRWLAYAPDPPGRSDFPIRSGDWLFINLAP